MNPREPALGVLGGGSWGTALAVHASRVRPDVTLWCRREDQAEQLIAERRNTEYLPGVELPSALEVTCDLAIVAQLPEILLVVPSHGFRETLQQLLEQRRTEEPLTLVSATKGIETGTHARMSEIVAAEAAKRGPEVRFGVLSGPSFAAELAREKPTAAVVAATDLALAERLRNHLSDRTLRLYSSDDVVGVELAGTAKNVIAIAAGLVSGLELGTNTLAALITRGLHEISRLGRAFGGRAETFSGLAGLGDLVLTCTGSLSRNRSTGLELARGKTLEEIRGSSHMVAEGVLNSKALQELARERGVELPIVDQVVAVLYEGKDPRAATEELMTRSLRTEAGV